MSKRYVPNIVRGGIAVPLANKTNYYLMKGRKHKNGGIDIGSNPKTGLEVEDGEVMHVDKNSTKVFSAVPFLNGKSPAERVVNGEDPNDVFRTQELYKEVNGINDDGSMKRNGGVYSITVNGKTSLRYLPSTGLVRGEAEGVRDKAPYGTASDTDNRSLSQKEDSYWEMYKKRLKERRKYFTQSLPGKKVSESAKSISTPTNQMPAYLSSDTIRRDTNIIRQNIIPNADNNIKDSGAKADSLTQGNQSNDIDFNNISKRTTDTYNRYRIFNLPTGNKDPKAGAGQPQDPKAGAGQRKVAKADNTRTSELLNIRKGIDVPTITNNFESTLSKINIPDRVKPAKSPSWIGRTLGNIRNTADAVGVGVNTIGSFIANRLNDRILDRMEYAPAPARRQAAKLKTKINIAPQLDKMRETLANYERNIDSNTASSKAAVARKQIARLNMMENANQIYGNKENLETELINKDRLNQQAVTSANIADYNNWLTNKSLFDNTLLEKRADNNVDLINNINAGVQDWITRREKRDSERRTRAALALANPNVTPQMLVDYGVLPKTDVYIKKLGGCRANRKR